MCVCVCVCVCVEQFSLLNDLNLMFVEKIRRPQILSKLYEPPETLTKIHQLLFYSLFDFILVWDVCVGHFMVLYK